MEKQMLLIQNDFEKSNILEEQMFREAIDSGILKCIQEGSFTGIRHVLSKRKVQKYLHGIFDDWILSSTELNRYLLLNNGDRNHRIILFLNTTFAVVKYPYWALKNLKERYGLTYALYYIDSISRPVCDYANYLRECGIFDLVYSFDQADCDSHGLKYWPTPYSKCKAVPEPGRSMDLYFCGVETDRREMIQQILSSAEARMEMDIVREKEGSEVIELEKGWIRYHSIAEIVPYTDVINHVRRCKCILEILRPGQTGLTLRPYEAIVYNKKLLTNNKDIVSFPYYSENNVRIFSNARDIDWDWVKSEDEVDYHYDGRYSPKNLLYDILKSVGKDKCFDGKKG